MQQTIVSALVAACALSTLAAAGPIEIRGKAMFTVDQVAVQKFYKQKPISIVMSTYNKFAKAGAKAPKGIRKAASASQTGTVVASPEAQDESYLCPVTVGGQVLNLDFDTGSSDLWVFSKYQSSSSAQGHATYTPGSTASLQSGQSWNIQYGDGSGASGIVYSDKVAVGAVTATSQAVEAATSVSSSFTQDTANDGLLGLAFSSINTVVPKQQLTFFDSVKSTLASPVFTAKLKKGQPGSYDFGYIDKTKYTGSITYVNVDNSQGFWGFTAGGYAVGSGAFSTKSSIGSSIADTGTSLLYLPSGLVTAYYTSVAGASYSNSQGGYVFPCATVLPALTIGIGSGKFVVPGTYLNFSPIDSAGTTCFGGLQANTGIGFSIFGDIFLKSVFVVFSETSSTPQLGFAKQS